MIFIFNFEIERYKNCSSGEHCGPNASCLIITKKHDNPTPPPPKKKELPVQCKAQPHPHTRDQSCNAKLIFSML